jgi:hypothetical protein
MLARYAGFQDLSPDELEQFDLEDFIRRSTRAALEGLREESIHPTMTAEELMKLTRGQ